VKATFFKEKRRVGTALGETDGPLANKFRTVRSFLPDYLFEPANLLTMTAIVDMGPQERARIFGGTAIEVYRLANLNEAVLLFL
jgi:hypothetical protein